MNATPPKIRNFLSHLCGGEFYHFICAIQMFFLSHLCGGE
ncbi:hypothetical protein [uncultured Gammaproteobacteria bacterium]|nr:hypothetical protein [uncultured Gammaproteobacteria bacterium]CAC9651663.1 hypothetical protein [uncultured Gammaproteobacteria bacterium]